MSEGPLGVLHVAQPTDGGVARCAIALAADQAGRGWRVSVACPDGPLAEELAELGVPRLRWQARRAPGPATLHESSRLAGLVAAFAPQLVHLHSSKAGLAGRMVLRGRLPTVFQPHAWSFEAVAGPARAAATAWERLGARWADVIVCVSEAEWRRGEEAGVPARYRVVLNGVDLVALPAAGPEERAAARARLGLSADPLAVSVGRLTWQKGQDVLNRAWPLVRAAVPSAQLVLVGDGPGRAELTAGSGDGIRLVGPSRNVADWLAAADVVVSASRWDGLSLVLLEALARGRSVVATDVTGAREALGESAGALVPPDDPAALAAAVAARFGDEKLRLREELAARARAEERFDIRRTMGETVAAYRDVLSSRDRAARNPAT